MKDLLVAFAAMVLLNATGCRTSSVEPPAPWDPSFDIKPSPYPARVQFADERKLDAGCYQSYAVLRLNRETLCVGDSISLDVSFHNRSADGAYFYNPYFNGLIPLPAILAIYSSRKEYIGDLLRFTGGSQATVSSHAWVWVPGGCYVGGGVSAGRAGYVPGTEHDARGHELPEGEYYLQLIYFKAFIAPRVADEATAERKDSIRNFYLKFDHAELFRSNVVKFQLTK